MKKIETAYGYDIYELTKEECKERWYEFPCFVVFDEGENYKNGIEQCSVGDLGSAKAWCQEYDRTYY